MSDVLSLDPELDDRELGEAGNSDELTRYEPLDSFDDHSFLVAQRSADEDPVGLFVQNLELPSCQAVRSGVRRGRCSSNERLGDVAGPESAHSLAEGTHGEPDSARGHGGADLELGQITVAKPGGVAREFQNDFYGARFAAALRQDRADLGREIAARNAEDLLAADRDRVGIPLGNPDANLEAGRFE